MLLKPHTNKVAFLFHKSGVCIGEEGRSTDPSIILIDYRNLLHVTMLSDVSVAKKIITHVQSTIFFICTCPVDCSIIK